MLIRLVKMTFQQDKVNEFLAEFEAKKAQIGSFPGCQSVELLNDLANPNIFFTYSVWNSEDDLEHYRNSELFNVTWETVKKLFAAKPEAWSVTKK